ncbi:hypothetical protein CYLTODRAFT_443245 [Cylindrobasidium torrendii FP15055 ss-10]|uniref:rRNA-processing protein FYV7 n=1 Tax=Cylindrobasidium torrendii FP15055 ss-10 TaxID=1314674 RepID=A0A0D7BEQ0_9AGAR|nr:hypothetical protein CYLTODRAFT_443245 [Cylindrobasidium torrendii FP15055 ss-10]
MAPSTPSADALPKKHVPTFKHMHPSRAKKLKQDWVFKQKVKSQWKAEKRKLGLAPKRTELESRHDADVKDDRDSEPGDEDTADVENVAEVSTSAKTPKSNSRTRNGREPPSIRPRSQREPQPDSGNDGAAEFRELARQAYSPTSLHTYRSTNKFSKADQPKQRTGRGQPNMKLRMNVMLEKIKRSQP